MAEEVANQINGAISGNVATKEDIERLETSTKADIGLLRKDMEVMESRLRTGMAKQHTRVILWVAGLGGILLTLSKLYDFLF